MATDHHRSGSDGQTIAPSANINMSASSNNPQADDRDSTGRPIELTGLSSNSTESTSGSTTSGDSVVTTTTTITSSTNNHHHTVAPLKGNPRVSKSRSSKAHSTIPAGAGAATVAAGISGPGSGSTSTDSPKTSTRQTHTAFIHKLYQMLEDSNMAHLIWWSKSADSFVIVPSEEFAKALSSYFKHTNISSFVRQLNMYGFHKVNESFPGYQADSSQWEFRHGQGSFKRGDLNALRDIKRRTSSKSVPSTSLLSHSHSHSHSHPPSQQTSHMPSGLTTTMVTAGTVGTPAAGSSVNQAQPLGNVPILQTYQPNGTAPPPPVSSLSTALPSVSGATLPSVSTSTSLTPSTTSSGTMAPTIGPSHATPPIANLSLKSVPTINSSSSSGSSFLHYMSGPRTSYFSNLPQLIENQTADVTTSPTAQQHAQKYPAIIPKEESHVYVGGNGVPPSHNHAHAQGGSHPPHLTNGAPVSVAHPQHAMTGLPANVTQHTSLAPSHPSSQQQQQTHHRSMPYTSQQHSTQEASNIEDRLNQLEHSVWQLREANQRLQTKTQTVCDVLRKTHADLPKILELVLSHPAINAQATSPSSGVPPLASNIDLPHQRPPLLQSHLSGSSTSESATGNMTPLVETLPAPMQQCVTQIRQNLYATSLMLSYLDDGNSSQAQHSHLGSVSLGANKAHEHLPPHVSHPQSQNQPAPQARLPTPSTGPPPFTSHQGLHMSPLTTAPGAPPVRPVIGHHGASLQELSTSTPVPARPQSSVSLPTVTHQIGREHRVGSFTAGATSVNSVPHHSFQRSASAHLPTDLPSSLQSAPSSSPATGKYSDVGKTGGASSGSALEGAATAPAAGSVHSLLNPAEGSTQLPHKRQRNI